MHLRVGTVAALVTLASIPPPSHAQQGVTVRVNRLLDTPPFDRATWGIILMDTTGRVVFEHNADRLFVPASNTKLVVSAAASALFPEEFDITTSLYATGPLQEGTLRGDLIIYGRGDPTFSDRCYGPDTLALGACEWTWSRMYALADSLVARGVREIEGAIVADGSYFDAEFVHPAWEHYDLNWWYASPVSALGFNDNSIAVRWGPGPTVGAPARVSLEPDLGNFLFENRTRTAPSGTRTTIDFFRKPGTLEIWAEGMVAEDHGGRTEYFALPDPNLFFAQAFRAALAERQVGVGGPTLSTTDSLRYRDARQAPALVSFSSRPRDDLIFPILNASQNWFAEMLLKVLGREIGGEGSWEAGLDVEGRFLVDSVGIDSTAFSLTDGSGLSAGNLVSPRALAQLLLYMWKHPSNGGFLRALPRAGGVGSLRDRYTGTALEGRVVAKTGAIRHVNGLSGYIEHPRRGPLIFSVVLNDHATSGNAAIRQIDAVVVELGR